MSDETDQKEVFSTNERTMVISLAPLLHKCLYQFIVAWMEVILLWHCTDGMEAWTALMCPKVICIIGSGFS